MVQAATPFAPTFADTAASRRTTADLLAEIDTSLDVSFDRLQASHAAIVGVAKRLAGNTLDAAQRAVVYYSVYEDSKKNLLFPMIAAHGSLWGVKHTRQIEAALQRVERWSRRGRVARWRAALDDVRDINRRVFIEIYSTFYFTRAYGRHPLASRLIKPEILALYNRVHDAVRAEVLLPYEERRAIYFDVFVHEQGDIVDPGLHAAAEACVSPLVVALLSRVRPRFAYFPPGQRLVFTDFVSVDQRNREGLRACDFAEQVGDARVLEAMAEY